MVVKQVKRETNMIPYNKHAFHSRLNVKLAEKFTSHTRRNLLNYAHILLQNLIREKELIQELYECVIMCSCDEVLSSRKYDATA